MICLSLEQGSSAVAIAREAHPAKRLRRLVSVGPLKRVWRDRSSIFTCQVRTTELVVRVVLIKLAGKYRITG